MNINALVKKTLTPLSIPLSFLKYSGKATTYMTYFCYNEQGEAWAENVEIKTGYYVQVDLWSKEDCTELAEQVKAAMITAGFTRTTAQDLYEDDTKIYHKAMRFSYV
jgi:hypothetical protein